MNVVAIIQARTDSTRLPGKVLKEICGRPVILRMLERVRRCKLLKGVVLATSVEPADDALATLVRESGTPVFRGSASDVLDRCWQAARSAQAEVVVRLTGDCPLHDPGLIDEAVGAFLARRDEWDYLSNTLKPTYPDGLDVEVFSFEALERAAREAKTPFEREHVTPYIHGLWEGTRSPFRVGHHTGQADFSHLRWTVDEPEDLDLVRRIFAALLPEKPEFTWLDVVALQTRDPTLLGLNRHYRRNEGAERDWARQPSARPVPERPWGREARRFDRSNALFERASRRIPTASQTFSKSHTQYVRGVSPLFLSHGRGGHVWDVDGHEYVDLVGGNLPVVLGYGDPEVNAAVLAQLERGVTFSLATEREIELAEELARLVPCAEMVRYAKNGSDVTSAAVRLARACTGRDHVAACGYHGWHDWYIGSTSRHKGVPDAVRGLTHTFVYNDLDSLARRFDELPGQIAAVILEPTGGQTPAEGFLEGVRDLAHRNGAILIFDEIITGFRWHLGGAQSLYGVTPDLATFGKAMANGFPLSALAGRRELMREFEEVFFSGTFGGEALSLAAAAATLRKLERDKVIDRLWALGRTLQEGIRRRIAGCGLASLLSVVGPACWPILKIRGGEGADEWEVCSFIRQELVQRGVLVLNAHNLCHAHAEEDMAWVLAAYDETLGLLRAALRAGAVGSSLRGVPVRPVFAVR